MIRYVKTHVIDDFSAKLGIEVSELGDGCSEYVVSDMSGQSSTRLPLDFHCGTIEDGPKGITNEVLLAIVCDRLLRFIGMGLPVLRTSERWVTWSVPWRRCVHVFKIVSSVESREPTVCRPLRMRD